MYNARSQSDVDRIMETLSNQLMQLVGDDNHMKKIESRSRKMVEQSQNLRQGFKYRSEVEDLRSEVEDLRFQNRQLEEKVERLEKKIERLLGDENWNLKKKRHNFQKWEAGMEAKKERKRKWRQEKEERKRRRRSYDVGEEEE
eukprot:GILI01038502.1.p2 GENE.GILI01038502.1~~GILI01038502.1.p2  ORF type:complete len:157 (-),score=24.79 GILI01038502.1:173-601(-)